MILISITQEQINQMIALAKKFEEDEKIQLEKPKAKNALEKHCNEMLKTVKSADLKKKVNEALSYYRSNDESLSKDDILRLLNSLKLNSDS